MEAKDTVISDEEMGLTINNAINNWALSGYIDEWGDDAMAQDNYGVIRRTQAEISFKAGQETERKRIKHAICFNGHLVTTQYGHGYHIGDQLWLELFPKDNGKPN